LDISLDDSQLKFFLPQEQRCKFRADKFHLSKTPVMLQPSGWLINKKMPKNFKELINLKLMWLHSTGLLTSPHLRTDETGIASTRVIDPDCPRVKESAEKGCPQTEADGPRPLSLFQLKNAFIGLVVGYLVSLVAFAVEYYSTKVRIPPWQTIMMRLKGLHRTTKSLVRPEPGFEPITT